MIHATVMSNPTIFNVRPVQRTEYTGNRFERTKLTYIVQFTNDMDGSRKYAYPTHINDFGSETWEYQYSNIQFEQVNTEAEEDVYKGKIYLQPSGFWYYVICEVYFFEGILVTINNKPFSMISPGYAPIDFDNNFDKVPELCNDEPCPIPSPGEFGDKGQLGIIVEEGKLQVKQIPTQVEYKIYKEGTTNNYIYNGE